MKSQIFVTLTSAERLLKVKDDFALIMLQQTGSGGRERHVAEKLSAEECLKNQDSPRRRGQVSHVVHGPCYEKTTEGAVALEGFLQAGASWLRLHLGGKPRARDQRGGAVVAGKPSVGGGRSLCPWRPCSF